MRWLRSRDADRITCHLCGEAVDVVAKWPDPWSATIDHVIPLAKGGPHTYDNIKTAHFWCNSVKSDQEGFTLIPAEVVV